MKNKKKIAVFILCLLFVCFLIAAYKYYKFSQEYATTDAIFIRSDKITNLSFKRVKGKISKLYVREGDKVLKGQLVAEIDPVDYKIKLNQLKKKISSLIDKKIQLIIQKNRIDSEINIKKQKIYKNISMLREKVKSIDSQISEISTSISQLQRDYKRYKNLFKKNVVAKRDYEKVETELKSLKERKASVIYQKKALIKQIGILREDLKLIDEEKKHVKELIMAIKSLTKQIEVYKEQAKDLKHSIDYCKIYAPFSGYIGKKYAEVGMNVKSGNPIYSLVDRNSLYVEVLLEETKLKGVKVGCKAFFKVDSYKDKEFEGIVEKIYPASAATYALVPRDISAGEFTKVAQRIIIRVKITKGDKSLLIPGMGGEIKIRRK